MSLIRNMFKDANQRTTAIGIWVSGFSVGSAIGPLVGGFLLEHFWWGSVFLLGVPVMGLLLIAGPVLLPEYKDPNPGRFDLPSAGMSLSAVLLMIYGLTQITHDGLTALPILSIVAGLAIGFVFVQRQRTLVNPLIDLKLFRVPAFSASLTTYTVGIFVSFGVFLFIAQYLQLVLGLSPLNAGLWSVPGALAFIIGSNLSPKLVSRIRPALVVAGGLVIAAFGMFLITQVGTNSLFLVVTGNTLMSLGFGFTFTLTVDMVVAAAPPERAGAASAMSETGAELGGALGLAVLGSLGLAVYGSQVASTLPAGIPPEVARAAQETLGGAVAVAAQVPDNIRSTFLDAAHNAFVTGLQVNAIIGVVGFVFLVFLTLTMLRHVQPHSAAESETEPQPTVPQPTTHPQPSMQMCD
jgi:DHA2 family multidrug resistance protein-like MFS transporter